MSRDAGREDGAGSLFIQPSPQEQNHPSTSISVDAPWLPGPRDWPWTTVVQALPPGDGQTGPQVQIALRCMPSVAGMGEQREELLDAWIGLHCKDQNVKPDTMVGARGQVVGELEGRGAVKQ